MLRIRSPTILLHNVKKLYKTNKKFFQKSESFKPKSTTIFWLSLIFHDNFLYTNYCNGWIRQNNSQSAENLLAKHLTMCRRRRRRKILVPCDQVDDGISYNCLRLYRQHIKKRLAHTHTHTACSYGPRSHQPNLLCKKRSKISWHCPLNYWYPEVQQKITQIIKK